MKKQRSLWLSLCLTVALLIVVAFQACVPLKFSSLKSSAQQASSGGGNGEPFDSKPGLGTYYQIIPDLKCNGQFAIYAKLVVEEAGARLQTLNPADCSMRTRPISRSEIDFRPFNPAFIGYADRLFEKHDIAPLVGGGTIPLVDVICHRPQAANKMGSDLVVRFNPSTGRARMTMVQETPLAPAGLVALGTASREVFARRIKYNSAELELAIDTSKGIDPQNFVVLGSLSGQLLGESVNETVTCRTAGLLDRQLDSMPLLPPSPGQILFASSFESGSFEGWSWVSNVATNTTEASVLPASSFSALALDGSHAARFYNPVGQQAAQIQKHWSPVQRSDVFGRPNARLPNDDPSAVYSAWYFLPDGYLMDASTEEAPIFAFQEKGVFSGASPETIMGWHMDMGPARAWSGGQTDEPVLFLNHGPIARMNPKTVPAPRGRWFEIRAHLYQGDRIDFYVDGTLFETARSSVAPVGRSASNHEAWIWTLGVVWSRATILIDGCTVRALP